MQETNQKRCSVCILLPNARLQIKRFRNYRILKRTARGDKGQAPCTQCAGRGGQEYRRCQGEQGCKCGGCGRHVQGVGGKKRRRRMRRGGRHGQAGGGGKRWGNPRVAPLCAPAPSPLPCRPGGGGKGEGRSRAPLACRPARAGPCRCSEKIGARCRPPPHPVAGPTPSRLCMRHAFASFTLCSAVGSAPKLAPAVHAPQHGELGFVIGDQHGRMRRGTGRAIVRDISF